MNYYSHHIGDFDRATRHLSRIERSIYMDMLFVYYDTEAPLTLDVAALCRKIMAKSEEEKAAVLAILDEFFLNTPKGWFHDRCEQELDDYRKSKSQASAAGKASAAAKAERRRLALGDSPTGDERRSNDRSTVVQRPFNDRSTEPQRLVNDASTPSQPTNNQEPITNRTSTAMSSDDDFDAVQEKNSVNLCPVGTLVDLYHEHMPSNPRVKVLNDARQRLIRARWREAAKLDCEPFGYETRSEGLTAWAEFFKICGESKFLTGMTPAQAGKPPFVADIDFLFSPSGFAKTLENKYHRDT